MNRLPLTLIIDDPRHADAARQRADAALAHAPTGLALKLTTITLQSIVDDPEQLPRRGVAWLILHQPDRGDLYEMLGLLQERHLPAMLTLHEDDRPAGTMDQEGVVVCPPVADDATACLMLRTLISQAPVFDAVNAELKLMRVQEGGISSQFDKMDEELRLAAKLQREFLPRQLPELAHARFAVLWQPASYVSGDIYDVQQLDEEHVGIFIADAVGHGVPAALMTMYIKRSLPTRRIDPAAPRGFQLIEPCDALAQLNRDMVAQQNGQVRFATACYAILNCITGTLRIARAGHPYPLLLKADGSTTTIEPDGGLLGVFEEGSFEQTRITLQPRDRVIFYSDGFELTFPPQIQQQNKPKSTHDAYARLFEPLRTGCMNDALGQLSLQLANTAGSLNQQDDLTIICVDMNTNN